MIIASFRLQSFLGWTRGPGIKSSLAGGIGHAAMKVDLGSKAPNWAVSRLKWEAFPSGALLTGAVHLHLAYIPIGQDLGWISPGVAPKRTPSFHATVKPHLSNVRLSHPGLVWVHEGYRCMIGARSGAAPGDR